VRFQLLLSEWRFYPDTTSNLFLGIIWCINLSILTEWPRSPAKGDASVPTFLPATLQPLPSCRMVSQGRRKRPHPTPRNPRPYAAMDASPWFAVKPLFRPDRCLTIDLLRL